MNAPALRHRMGAALVAAVLTLTGVSVSAPQRALAVVGGVPTAVEQVPWQALVIVDGSPSRLCAGSIVDREWIITAAHCVADASPGIIQAHVGLDDLRQRSAGNQVNVAEIVVHPAWEPTKYRNDVALLKLSAPLSLGPRVAPVALPAGFDAAVWPPSGTPASISGWGATRAGGSPSNELRAADIRVLGGPGDVTCGQYGSDFFVDVEICAGLPEGGVDACQGDSGGPLIVREGNSVLLAGITSFGGECARAGYPGIYTRITTFIPWIQQFVPAVAAVPSKPQNVTVEALAGERLLVQWEAPSSGLLPVAYRAVAQPGNRQCQTDASASACVIEGVPAGKLFDVVLTSVLSSGNEISAEPVQAVSVDGVTSTGVVIKPRRLALWAGVKTRARDEVRLAVRPRARTQCVRVGSVANPRGVRTKEPGLCAVRVTVTRPDGKSVRAIAYVDVRTG